MEKGLTFEEWHNKDRRIRARRLATRLSILGVVVLVLFLVPPPLVGSRWELQAINGERPLVSPMPITAEFRLWLGPWMRGNTGCNSYEALYFQANKVLKIIPLTTTNVLCSASELSQQEEQFLSILLDARTYDVKQDRLIMSTIDGKELIFSRR